MAERARVTWAAFAVVFLFGAYITLSYPLNHDLAWLLYVGGKVLDGVPLYDRIVEVNPPLIIWFSAVSEAFARLLGAWDVTVYRGIVLALAGVSALLCRQQLAAFEPRIDATTRDLLTVLLAYLFVAHVGFEFGQREHLTIVLVLPYLLLTARQITSDRDSTSFDHTSAAFAGFGFALKPHFVAVWLIVLAYAAFKRRGRILRTSPQLITAAIIFAYAIVVVLVARNYFSLLRLAAGPYNLYVNVSPKLVLFASRTVITFIAVVISLLLLEKTVLRELARVLALAALAFLVMTVAQAKLWNYHWIPSTVIAVVLGAAALWTTLLRWRALQRLPLSVALPVAAGLLLCGFAAQQLRDISAQQLRMQGKAYQLQGMIPMVERYAHGRPIAALSTNMQAAFPLVNYTGAQWALRFNTLWLLPGVYPPAERVNPVQYHALNAMPAAERYMFDSVIADLTQSQPAILVVDRVPPGYVLQGFDYLTYFGRDARFAAFMRSYHEVAPVERYRVFIRNS